MPESLALHELLSLCIRGGRAEHWENLLARVQPLIAKTAWRVASSNGAPQPEEVDDIVQETCMKLGATRTTSLGRVALESEASAFAYIKVVALNTARDHFAWRRRRPASAESDLPVALDQFAAAPNSNVDRQILLSQIDSALATDERGRTVFWLYYRQGFTSKEIAQIPEVGLSIKGVESLLNRLTTTVRRAIGGDSEKGKAAVEAL